MIRIFLADYSRVTNFVGEREIGGIRGVVVKRYNPNLARGRGGSIIVYVARRKTDIILAARNVTVMHDGGRQCAVEIPIIEMPEGLLKMMLHFRMRPQFVRRGLKRQPQQ